MVEGRPRWSESLILMYDLSTYNERAVYLVLIPR